MDQQIRIRSGIDQTRPVPFLYSQNIRWHQEVRGLPDFLCRDAAFEPALISTASHFGTTGC